MLMVLSMNQVLFPFSLPLKLDIYKPENIYDNRTEVHVDSWGVDLLEV